MNYLGKILINAILGIGILFAQTVLSVQPASISDRELMPGDTLTVDIYIQNVTDLYAYQFSLQYKPDVLTLVKISKGPFLSQGGVTWFFVNAERRCGYVIASETLQGAVPGVNGSGVLTKILFRVNKKGKTYLDLAFSRSTYMENMLLSSSLSDIGFSTENGQFSNE